MPPRVVADTNFWVSVAGWSGSARRLYLELLAGKFVHVTSFEILNEIGRVLRWLPGFDDRMVYDWYCEIGAHSEIIAIQSLSKERIRVCRDPDDDKLLECAVLGHATHMITRDKDLLALKSYQGVQIIKPDELWPILE